MSICARYGLAEFAFSMTRLGEYVCAGIDNLTTIYHRLLDDILVLGKKLNMTKDV